MNDDRWKHDKGVDDDLPKVPGAPYAVPEGFFESEVYLVFIDLLAEYVLFDRAPKILAAAARAKSGVGFSPRDFECPCPVDAEDGLPRCYGKRADCRFSSRPADTGAPITQATNIVRRKAALEAMAEEVGAFFKADEAGRRAINQRLSQAAARRRRRAAKHLAALEAAPGRPI